MSTKLFIGGLSWNTNDDGLRDAFARFGEVVEAKVVTDRETGRSRGFGFVTFNDEQEAQNCMDEMDNSEFDGRTIKVNLAHQKSSNHSRAPRNDWR